MRAVEVARSSELDTRIAIHLTVAQVMMVMILMIVIIILITVIIILITFLFSIM